MRVLMLGDVVGRPGRRAVQQLLPGLRQELAVDLVIANGENAAGGRGLTADTAAELLQAGVDVITTGNHVWDQKEVREYLAKDVPVLRPLNYPAGVPGRGYLQIKGAVVVNLAGRVFMDPIDCPFQAVERLLTELDGQTPVTIVDFHAEATAEKQALSWHLDGRVSAVLGTHTHVPSADLRILPKGTAHVTDVGMVGPWNSVIGARAEPVVSHFLTRLPARFEVADGPVAFNSVLVEIDSCSGRALEIRRVDQILNDASLA